jgi:hypothetical protein
MAMKPRAGTAVLLSALLPGLGQLYNGQRWKGAVFLLGIIALDAVLSVSDDMLLLLRSGPLHMDVVTPSFLLVRMVPLVGIGFWSILDAARHAKPPAPSSSQLSSQASRVQ